MSEGVGNEREREQLKESGRAKETFPIDSSYGSTKVNFKPEGNVVYSKNENI